MRPGCGWRKAGSRWSSPADLWSLAFRGGGGTVQPGSLRSTGQPTPSTPWRRPLEAALPRFYGTGACKQSALPFRTIAFVLRNRPRSQGGTAIELVINSRKGNGAENSAKQFHMAGPAALLGTRCRVARVESRLGTPAPCDRMGLSLRGSLKGPGGRAR